MRRQQAIARLTPSLPASVRRWNGLIQQTLLGLNVPITPRMVYAVAVLIQYESGGDPNAINDRVINAQRGTPSKGLIQTIDPTFQAYRSPELPNDPYDPAANLYAGLNYGIDRYGSIEIIPGIKAVLGGGTYEPY